MWNAAIVLAIAPTIAVMLPSFHLKQLLVKTDGEDVDVAGAVLCVLNRLLLTICPFSFLFFFFPLPLFTYPLLLFWPHHAALELDPAFIGIDTVASLPQLGLLGRGHISPFHTSIDHQSPWSAHHAAVFLSIVFPLQFDCFRPGSRLSIL